MFYYHIHVHARPSELILLISINSPHTIPEQIWLKSKDISMWIKFKYGLNKKKAFDLWAFLTLIYPAEFCDLALVDTWRSQKGQSLNLRVTRKSRWRLFTLNHNPTKFNGHWRCETEDAHFCDTWLDGGS